jgi:hypothetical protein
MNGQHIKVIINLPRIQNGQRFAKYLLSSDKITFNMLGSWSGEAHIAVWKPAYELLDFHSSDTPIFVYSELWSELRELLVEVGIQSNNLYKKENKQLRVAIVDAQPLLGPEARENIREMIRERLMVNANQNEVLRITSSWSFFGTTDLAIDRQSNYDVIISIGVGANSSHTVQMLRASLADAGAMILVSNRSASDITSIQTVSSPNWDPYDAIEKFDYPHLFIPGNSRAVIADELASLFDDFGDIPLPYDTIIDVFSSDYTNILLKEWEHEGRVTILEVFENSVQSIIPERKKNICLSDKVFSAVNYKIPWGCNSKKVCKLYDSAASDYITSLGQQICEYIDHERLFIDMWPGRLLRYPPNTVRIGSYEPLKNQNNTNFDVVGRIIVDQLSLERCINLNNRKPRFFKKVVNEQPFRKFDNLVCKAYSIDDPNISSAIETLILNNDNIESSKKSISGSMSHHFLSQGLNSPDFGMISGRWISSISEVFRDVVSTGPRLIEEAGFIAISNFPEECKAQLKRTYKTVSVNVYLSIIKELDTIDSEIANARLSYSAHKAISNLLELFIQKKFISDSSNEYRTLIIENDSNSDLLTKYRIVIYRLRENEFNDELHINWLYDDIEMVKEFILWAHELLATCTCGDGCAACCGGVGTATKHDLQNSQNIRKFDKTDIISRKGALALLCGLMGRKYDQGDISLLSVADIEEPAKESQLLTCFTEIIGTKVQKYQDGVWYKLFGEFMPMNSDLVADAVWEDTPPDSIKKEVAYYSVAENKVAVMKECEPSLSYLKDILIHEYTHNWQHTGGCVDYDELVLSEESKRYFDGKLVAEGHAMWAENVYRISCGKSPVFKPTDNRNWDEYKVGYYLFEGLERAVGERGLFKWLQLGKDAEDTTIVSRKNNLSWPFSLQSLLMAIRPPNDSKTLYEYAINGSFTSGSIYEQNNNSTQAETDKQDKENPEI